MAFAVIVTRRRRFIRLMRLDTFKGPQTGSFVEVQDEDRWTERVELAEGETMASLAKFLSEDLDVVEIRPEDPRP